MITEAGRLWRRRELAFFALLGCVSLILAACGTPDPRADRRFSPGANPGGKILFAQNGDIYIYDGSIKKLTNVGDASLPRWSGDGSQFVFVRTGDAFSDIWVANADGSNLRQLTHDQPTITPGSKAYVDQAVWALDPAWSRTGDTIAFVSDRGTPKNYLWLMKGLDANATRVAASTVNGDNVERPDFSSDGTKIVFAQRTTGSTDLQRWTQLWIADLTTGRLIPLVRGEQSAYDPSWSPDGKWIAYVQRTGTSNDIWVIPADGGQPVQLTNVGDATTPTWSPDGTRIAFLVTDGVSFKAQNVSFSVDASGAPKAGKPQDLFSAGNVDAVSGLSWAP